MNPLPFPNEDLARLAPLFDEYRELRAVIDSVLEGRVGAAFANSATHPETAALAVGCYRIVGGNPGSETARQLVTWAQIPGELIVPSPGAWQELALEVHGERAALDPMRGFDPSGIDPRSLVPWIDSPPPGYELRRLDRESAGQLGPELSPHALQVFLDPEDFVQRGVGFGAFRGPTLVSAATSYTVCQGRIEVAISTRPGHRGRGLARSVAARLIHHCLERDALPWWNAASPASQHLARSLGYRPAGICHSIRLQTEPSGPGQEKRPS